MTPEILKLYEKLQKLFREKMGEPILGDAFCCGACNSLRVFGASRCVFVEANILRLPLPIDPVNPERGLAGMIRGGWELLKSQGMDECFITISPMSIKNYDAKERNNVLEGKSPTEALLRALIAQEGL